MEPEVIVFMPNGDVTLTLIRNIYDQEEEAPLPPRLRRKLSAVQQTPIDEDKQLEFDDTGLEDVLEDESLLFYAPEPPNASEGPSYPPTPRAVRGSDASSRRDRSSSPPASFWANLKRQQAARSNEAVVEEEEEPIPAPKPTKKERNIVSSHEVHCVVSSKHMMLASQVFENLLTGDSVEGRTLRAKGHVTIPVLADLDTVIVLLNIIHGPSRKVPRKVTLLELSNLATLVSNFGMIETVQFFSDTWIDALQREGLPKSYNEDVLRLLFVFWVFDRPEEFKNMTRLTQRECDENLLEDVKSVPIPHKIIDAIKREREYAIETAITIIHTLISRYMDGQTICDASLDEDLQYACDAMVLGSLMKSSRKINIWPRPEAPFESRKFKDLARAIRSIKILDVCNRSSRRFATLGTSSNCHGLVDEIEVSMKSIEAGLDGLELLEYPKKTDDVNAGFQMFVLATEEEVVEPVKENGVHDLQHYPEEQIVPESPVDDWKEPPAYSSPESRTASPLSIYKEVERPVQEPTKPVSRRPSKPVSQDFDYTRHATDSRNSSRASDYQVQEPAVVNIKEDEKPNISRNSPSQEWMNPGRVVAKPISEPFVVRESEERRPREVIQTTEARFANDRSSDRNTSPARARLIEQKANGNGSAPGGTNGNEITKTWQTAPIVTHIEEEVEDPPRYQQIQQVSHPTKSPITAEHLEERRPGRTPSNERVSYSPHRRTTQPERSPFQDNSHHESRQEHSSLSERVSHPLQRSSQPEQTVQQASQSERKPLPTSTGYAVKRTPPPGSPAPQPQLQRANYPEQFSQPIKTSQPASQPERTVYSGRQSYNGQTTQPEAFSQQQKPTQIEKPITPVEKPAYVSQPSYNSRPEVLQSHQRNVHDERSAPSPDNQSYTHQVPYTRPSQQQVVSQPERRIVEVETPSYTSQASSYQRPAQEEVSQPQGKGTQNEKPSYTSMTSAYDRPSQEEVSQPSPKPVQTEKPFYNTQTSSYKRPSQEEVSQPEKKAAPPVEKPSYASQTTSSSYKRPTQEEVQQPSQRVVEPEKSSYPSQSSSSYKRPSQEEVSQPQQKAAAPQVEKPTYNSQTTTYKRPSQEEVSQPQQQQQQKPTQPERSSHAPQSQNSQTKKPSQPDVVSPPQQQSQQQLKAQQQQQKTQSAPIATPQSKTVSPPPAAQQQSKENNNTASTTEGSTEIDETWGQPQKFNMRKSKKKFSTRF